MLVGRLIEIIKKIIILRSSLKTRKNFEEQLQPKIPKLESIKLDEKTGNNSNWLPRKSASYGNNYIYTGKKLTRLNQNLFDKLTVEQK